MLKAVMFVHNYVTFFSHILDTSFEIADKDRINNFVNAIDLFAKDVYKSSLNSINLGSYTLMIENVPLHSDKNEYFNIICFVDKDDNQKVIRDYIESIQHGFLQIFSPQDIIAWDGNILKFLPFKKIINKIVNLPKEQQNINFNAEPEIEKKYQINESVLFGIIDQNRNILDSYTYSKESELQISMPNVVSKVAGNISLTTFRWEGIIPFLEEKQIALILVMQTDDKRILSHYNKAEPVFILVAYTVPESFQVDFSRSARLISQCIQNNCLNVLNNQYLDNWSLIEEQIKTQLNNQLIENSPIRRIDTAEKQTTTLSDFANIKNVDNLIEGLITGYPIAIVGGSPDFARRIMHQCLFFTIHRSMSIIEYPKEIVDSSKVDIVLITEKESKKYKDFILVDLDKMVVKGGQSNKYCERMIKEILAIQESDLILPYLKRRINYLLSKATMIRNLSWETKEDLTVIGEIKADLDPGSENIVIRLAEGRNSLLQNLVDFLSKSMPKKSLLLDNNFIKFNEEKILVNTRISVEKNAEYITKLTKMGNLLLGSKIMDSFMKR
jgi:hypothetical protein